MGSNLAGIDPNQFALLSTVLAIALSDGLTSDEIISLGSFIAAVGDTMLLIGAQQILIAEA